MSFLTKETKEEQNHTEEMSLSCKPLLVQKLTTCQVSADTLTTPKLSTNSLVTPSLQTETLEVDELRTSEPLFHIRDSTGTSFPVDTGDTVAFTSEDFIIDVKSGSAIMEIESTAVGLAYNGTWDSRLESKGGNVPFLQSGVGIRGEYYVVSVASDPGTDLDGISEWQVGDWVTFNGTIWQKIDNSQTVVDMQVTADATTVTPTAVNDFGSGVSDPIPLADGTNVGLFGPALATNFTLTTGAATMTIEPHNGTTFDGSTVTLNLATNSATAGLFNESLRTGLSGSNQRTLTPKNGIMSNGSPLTIPHATGTLVGAARPTRFWSALATALALSKGDSVFVSSFIQQTGVNPAFTLAAGTTITLNESGSYVYMATWNMRFGTGVVSSNVTLIVRKNGTALSPGGTSSDQSSVGARSVAGGAVFQATAGDSIQVVIELENRATGPNVDSGECWLYLEKLS